MPRPGLFSTLFPWRVHPTFTVLTVATGQFSDFFLFGMRVPLLPHLIRTHLHVPETQVQSRVAVLLAAFSLATLLTAIPAGWLADFGWLRARLYLAGLGALLWSTIVFYTARTWETILLSRVLNGISAAVLYAAGFAMVVDVVPPGDLGKALGTVCDNDFLTPKRLSLGLGKKKLIRWTDSIHRCGRRAHRSPGRRSHLHSLGIRRHPQRQPSGAGG